MNAVNSLIISIIINTITVTIIIVIIIYYDNLLLYLITQRFQFYLIDFDVKLFSGDLIVQLLL